MIETTAVSLVDRLVEPLERDLRAVGGHDVHLGAAQLLRVPDLADRRELEVADHDLAAASPKSIALASALTPAESDVVTATSSGCAVDEARERRARRLGALDPVVPRRAALVPARQVVVVRGAHRVGERALRARVDVGEPLEDREPRAGSARDASR